MDFGSTQLRRAAHLRSQCCWPARRLVNKVILAECRVPKVIWQIPLSHNLMPHFEQVTGCQLLHVDGRFLTVLAAEIP